MTKSEIWLNWNDINDLVFDVVLGSDPAAMFERFCDQIDGPFWQKFSRMKDGDLVDILKAEAAAVMAGDIDVPVAETYCNRKAVAARWEKYKAGRDVAFGPAGHIHEFITKAGEC